MEKIYSIYLEDHPIGTAEVCRQGLFYQIRCTCGCKSGHPYRITVKGTTATVSLGQCVPRGDVCGMFCRIGIKRIGAGELHFYATEAHVCEAGRFIAVIEEVPFASIPLLRHAVLAEKDGRIGIVTKKSF